MVTRGAPASGGEAGLHLVGAEGDVGQDPFDQPVGGGRLATVSVCGYREHHVHGLPVLATLGRGEGDKSKG